MTMALEIGDTAQIACDVSKLETQERQLEQAGFFAILIWIWLLMTTSGYCILSLPAIDWYIPQLSHLKPHSCGLNYVCICL